MARGVSTSRSGGACCGKDSKVGDAAWIGTGRSGSESTGSRNVVSGIDGVTDGSAVARRRTSTVARAMASKTAMADMSCVDGDELTMLAGRAATVAMALVPNALIATIALWTGAASLRHASI